MNQPQQRAIELAYLQLADLYIRQMHQARDAWRATDQAHDRDSPAGVARQQRALAQWRACVIGGQLLPAPGSSQEMDGVFKAALLQYRSAVRLLARLV